MSWKKVLYEHQNYPDNYTDPHIFLKDLRKNISLQKITFKQACIAANPLFQQLCFVVLFIVIYLFIVDQRVVESSIVLYLFTFCTGIGYITYRKLSKDVHKLALDLRTAITFVSFGYLFSPVLHTLTDTISTNTIHTVTFLMLTVHLIFFDYGAQIVSSRSVSTSAAMFASICLASRLNSASDAFTLLSVATIIFVLSPILRKFFNNILLTIVLFGIVTVLLKHISNFGTIIFVTVILFLNVLCPYLFVRFQKYKDNIHGPWDEAVVIVKL